jgi:PAS domain S-box-containing protein
MEPSEDVLRGLVTAAPDALLAVDVHGQIRFASEQVERLFGWQRAELVGQRVECLVPERFRRAHPLLRHGYVQHPVPRPMGAGLDLWARRQDGTEFPAEISLCGFDTTEGPMVAVAIRDVTGARRNEQRLRAVLSSAPDAMIGVDAAGRIEIVNGQAETTFGWTAGELVGQRIEVLVPDAVAARHATYRTIFAGEPSSRPMGSGMQLAGRRKDGSTFPAEISLSSITEADGSLLVLAAVRDITDRVELERQRRQQAAHAQQEQSHRLEGLGQLAGGVAHDFNNLLGVILNYTTLLSRRFTDPGTAADLGEIRGAAERAAALTRQLLAFARSEEADPEPLDLNEVVTSFSALLNRTLGEQIQLRIELAAEPLVVRADRHQLEQILLNLAVNSRDAMPSGGVLTIVTHPCPGPADGERLDTNGEPEPSEGVTHARLEVVDTGLGMDPDVAARAFEPFFTTKPIGQGTGLGLATVFGIVRQNHGVVSIESAVGHGTKVAVDLPLIDAMVAPAPAAPLPTAGGRERILLVEDEGALRVATERILGEQGYDVHTASDGLDGLDVFERLGRAFDLVLTDVAMPRLRGDEMARLLVDRVPGLPVVFMSGYDSRHVEVGGRLLEKPVTEQRLLETIREVLDEPR